MTKKVSAMATLAFVKAFEEEVVIPRFDKFVRQQEGTSHDYVYDGFSVTDWGYKISYFDLTKDEDEFYQDLHIEV